MVIGKDKAQKILTTINEMAVFQTMRIGPVTPVSELVLLSRMLKHVANGEDIYLVLNRNPFLTTDEKDNSNVIPMNKGKEDSRDKC